MPPSPSPAPAGSPPDAPSPVAGLHHLTAIATDPQRNIDFYAGLLGLRLVKRTVNFDDPSAYHLYYGDASGAPGSIVTFFYWPGAYRGVIGRGQPTAITLSAPAGSLPYWEERLRRHGAAPERRTRFGEETLLLRDPDEIPVELVESPGDSRPGWTGAGVPAERALKGMHAFELTVRDAGPTEHLLTQAMGHRLVRREGGRARFESGPGGPGRRVDVIADPGAPGGAGGTGTIHHVAYRVAGDAEQLHMQERLVQAGYAVSEVRDRDYFRSIYYRERGGILFEIATDEPGFARDEAPSALGTALKLPRQFEPLRPRIEKALPPLAPPRSYA